jgi:hypothetical protein
VIRLEVGLGNLPKELPRHARHLSSVAIYRMEKGVVWKEYVIYGMILTVWSMCSFLGNDVGEAWRAEV